MNDEENMKTRDIAIKICLKEQKEADQLESLLPKIEDKIKHEERKLVDRVIAEENNCNRENMTVLTRLVFEARDELEIFKDEIKRKRRLVSLLEKLIY